MLMMMMIIRIGMMAQNDNIDVSIKPVLDKPGRLCVVQIGQVTECYCLTGILMLSMATKLQRQSYLIQINLKLIMPNLGA